MDIFGACGWAGLGSDKSMIRKAATYPIPGTDGLFQLGCRNLAIILLSKSSLEGRVSTTRMFHDLGSIHLPHFTCDYDLWDRLRSTYATVLLQFYRNLTTPVTISCICEVFIRHPDLQTSRFEVHFVIQSAASFASPNLEENFDLSLSSL